MVVIKINEDLESMIKSIQSIGLEHFNTRFTNEYALKLLIKTCPESITFDLPEDLISKIKTLMENKQ